MRDEGGALAARSPGRRLAVQVVTLRYPPYVGGGFELLTQDLVRALRARGHRVRVLTARGAGFEDEGVTGALLPALEAGVDPFERSFRASSAERFALHFFRLANYRATLHALEADPADACLFLNLGLLSLAPLVAARHRSVPAVGYVADPWPLNHWLLSWPRIDGRLVKPGRYKLLEWFWRGFRDLVGIQRLLVASAHLARRFEAGGIDRQALEVVHVPIPPDLEALAARVETLRRAPAEPLRVVCLSSFWKGKGQDVLIEAVRRARAEGAPIECVLAGAVVDAAFRAELEARVRAAGMEGVVSFVHGLGRAQVSRLLARSHVFALPSTWEEPFSQAALEAMAHGVCPLVSDAGGSPEAVTHLAEGWIARAGDARAFSAALSALAADEALRTRLAGAARLRVNARHAHAGFVDRIEAELEAAALDAP